MTHGEHATFEGRMTGAHGSFRNEATRLMTRRLMTQLGEINRVSSKQNPICGSRNSAKHGEDGAFVVELRAHMGASRMRRRV